MSTTNTLDMNNRIDKLEKSVSGGDSAQANKADIATEFSATTNYTAGCFVYYGGKLYQYNAEHSAGAWDPTDVVEANVTDQVVSNAAAIAGLTASEVMMSDGVTSVEDKLTDIGTVVSIIGTGNVQVPNDSATLIASKSLTKGVYLINIIYNWANNSSGIRKIIYTNDSVTPSPAPARQSCVSTNSYSGELYHNGVFVIQAINTKTIYFWAYQNSGTSLYVYPYIDAIKLQ